MELYYQNVLFIIFKLVGFYTEAEYHTSEGRIDLILKTEKYVYVMEFKLEGTAEEALRQIEEKLTLFLLSLISVNCLRSV